MKLEKVDYKEMQSLEMSGGTRRRYDRRAILTEFLDSDSYCMKLIFGKEDEEEMLEWLSRTGKSPKDYYLSVYNSYAAIISDDKKYKDKIQIKRFTKDESSMNLYLVRRDRTMAFGDDCQRRGYEW